MEDDYDPHVHRVQELANPTNNWETLFHLIKGCLGTGVLAMPEAYKMAGMINGIVSTIIVGAFCTYCFHVLLNAQYVLCKKRKVGLLIYAESMKVACEVGPEWCKSLPRFASGLTDFFLIFYQTGTCCIYVVFVGTNLKYVGDDLYGEVALIWYMLILLIPFALLELVRNLKEFAVFSIFGDIVTFITFGVIFYYIFKNFDQKFSDRPAVGRFVDYPLFFGTCMFSIQSVPIVISIENNMETPKHFTAPLGTLNVGFGFLTLVYMVVAMLGYWQFGEDIKSSITMNFPITEILAKVIIITYCVAIFITYGLNAYVPISILWNSYIVKSINPEETSERKMMLWEYLLRMAFVIFTFILATTVPLLGLFISLIGSVCLSALGIIFPAFIEIAANWEEKKSTPKHFLFWKDILIAIIGFFGLISGAYSSIRGIVEAFQSGIY